MLPQFRENPLLLVGKRAMHNCIEDGSEQAEWFNATVLHLAEDVTVGADPEYIIKYDTDEDDAHRARSARCSGVSHFYTHFLGHQFLHYL